jgi:hypothetical protein
VTDRLYTASRVTNAQAVAGLLDAQLVNPNAAWRSRPASEKQSAVLRRWGISVSPGLTAGESSDRISAGRR